MSLIKSKKRVADHGEVFTPPWLLEKMLDLVKAESERIESRFLEPACGSGNFLVAVFKRKLTTVEAKYGKQSFNKKLWALQALACCYGIELLEDNIAECRKNMLEVFAEYLGIGKNDELYRAASHVLSLNLVHGNAMTMETVPKDGDEPGPIMIVEWTYLKAGKFEFDEFDLNEFFKAKRDGVLAGFEHEDEVQRWLDIIRGQDLAQSYESLKTRQSPPWPYSNGQLLPWLQHSFWFLPNVAACYAMRDLLAERQNVFWHDYNVIVAAGANAGIGLDALPPVRRAIGSGHDTKTITLSCGKLTTGVTVPQWSSILMLRNLKSPETYFQSAFRVQSPWSIMNPDGDDPNQEEVLKPICFVFDFALTRALRQLSDYGVNLSPGEPNPEKAVADLVSFLPVLAFDGANMVQIDAGGILDIAMAGTSATLLARKWESAMLVNVDNDTLRRVLDSEEAMAAVERIEGWRALGDNVIETIINKSEKVKELKKKAKDEDLSTKEKKELTEEEKEYKSLRKKVQEKLIKFATRIPAFMYLTDFRENTLVDVITKIEPDLFQTVTGLSVADFNLLVDLKVFNTERMNAAVFAFRRYEDSSLRYTGIDSHEGLTHIGGYNTVVVKQRVEVQA